MMDYRDFVEQVRDSILDFLPDKYADGKVNLLQIVKTNDNVLDGITVTSPDSNIAPTIYLNDLYEEIKEGVPFEEVMETIAQTYVDHVVDKDINVDEMLSFEDVKDKIVCRLVNEENNAQFLSGKPYTQVEDLAVVYQIKVSDLERGGEASIPITDRMMAHYGVSVEEIHGQAMQNMESIHPHSLKSMREFAVDIMAKNIMDELGLTLEEARTVANEMTPDGTDEMFMLTNEQKLFGAAAILNEDTRQEIAEQVGGDFFVIPSSVHEVLIVPKEGHDYHELETMVHDVNRTEVAPNEVLSDHVYEVNAETREISRADLAEERAQQKEKEQAAEQKNGREEKSGREEKTGREEKSARPSLKDRLAEKKEAVKSADAAKTAPEKTKNRDAAR